MCKFCDRLDAIIYFDKKGKRTGQGIHSRDRDKIMEKRPGETMQQQVCKLQKSGNRIRFELLPGMRRKDREANMDEKGQNGETVLIGTVEHLDVERIISMHEKLARK